MDAVSEILTDRAHEADRLTGMVLLSFVVHVGLMAGFAFMPGRWQVTPDDRDVMVVSFGGPEGPVQGKNPISPRPVEVATPDPVKPQPVTPPAAAKPEM